MMHACDRRRAKGMHSEIDKIWTDKTALALMLYRSGQKVVRVSVTDGQTDRFLTDFCETARNFYTKFYTYLAFQSTFTFEAKFD